MDSLLKWLFPAAYGGGWRAGMAEQPLVRPGGTRGIKHLRTPLNPYSGIWCKRWRPVLAYVFELGQHDGMTENYRKWRDARKVARA